MTLMAGDAFQRVVEKVQEGVKNGYVTLKQAAEDYGVVLRSDTLEVDELVRA
ncbi:MAG: hypothetical protein BMS9Abin28_0283 [Anaerolineae bacterium]|nr:MAG: hypothetical protein BMS9Abin28_0283 [Anaerolineae bacterium]